MSNWSETELVLKHLHILEVKFCMLYKQKFTLYFHMDA